MEAVSLDLRAEASSATRLSMALMVTSQRIVDTFSSFENVAPRQLRFLGEATLHLKLGGDRPGQVTATHPPLPVTHAVCE
jgi:hypothetical protein